jgi:excisionase family DNA binding protein
MANGARSRTVEQEQKARTLLSKDGQERALKDVPWVAEFLGVSRSWVYQASSSGALPCVRIGALVRFDPTVIKAWVRGESAKTVTLPKCR